MSELIARALGDLRSSWLLEQKEAEREFKEEQQKQTLEEKVSSGNALKNVLLDEISVAPGDNLLLWLLPKYPSDLENFRLSQGTPLVLWQNESGEKKTQQAIFSKRKADKIGVMVHHSAAEFIEDGRFHLEKDFHQKTFEQGMKAIQQFETMDSRHELYWTQEILWGSRKATFEKETLSEWLDLQLNDSQKKAIELCMNAQQMAFIHGPPGTGKTRTLVELIRQCKKKGWNVLVTAASNNAIDHLCEQLLLTGETLVRLGNPARISNSLEDWCLDALVEKTETYQLARKWMAEARELQKSIQKKREKRQISREERKQMQQEIHALYKDARKQLRGIQEEILSKTQIICSTVSGSDSDLLKRDLFDVVIMDEATQSVDPHSLLALQKGKRIIMAGDPCQLSPTVKSKEAEKKGLGKTLFEKTIQKIPEACQMLEIQYRMNETLMEFPSQSMYHNALKAFPSNQHIQLSDLSVEEDFLRPSCLVFLDTSGKGWEELKQEEKTSTSNPEQAQRTILEVKRLLSRGLRPKDLAIISPYFAQVLILRNALQQELKAGLEIGTVDGFQGREKEAIVVDLVRSNSSSDIGFLEDIRRMNVAITRAKRFLLVIGDSSTIGNHSYYSQFLEKIEEKGAWISAWEDECPLFLE